MAESNVKLRVDARDAVSALNQTNNASKQLNQTLNTTSKRAGTATANIQRFGISFRSVVGPMVAAPADMPGGGGGAVGMVASGGGGEDLWEGQSAAFSRVTEVELQNLRR